MRETKRHLEAFEAWWDGGRSVRTCVKQCGFSERVVTTWVKEFDWHARADERDRELKLKLERDAVARRVKVLEDQRIAGELLRRRGVEYFRETKLDDGRVALAAITKGVELERQAENLVPEFVRRILSMSEEDLRKEHKLIQGEMTPDESARLPEQEESSES